MHLRRRIRHLSKTDVAPWHVHRFGRVEICDQEQVRRAIVPETSIHTSDVERLVRRLGVDKEGLDSIGNEMGQVHCRSFDGRHVTRRRWVLEGD